MEHVNQRRGRTAAWAAVASVASVAACSSPPPPPPAPPLDAGEISTSARVTSQLDQPARILFEWSMTERDGRFNGRGVARIEPPYRARLDLFLPGGETVARAALVDDDLRQPADVPEGMIPPPHLLWGVLGVFRPGAGAALLGAEEDGSGGVVLRYGYGEGREIRYRLRGRWLQEAELLEGGRAFHRVTLELDPGSRYPEEAVYRDLAGFRELRIRRESVTHVEPYPPDIWNPGG